MFFQMIWSGLAMSCTFSMLHKNRPCSGIASLSLAPSVRGLIGNSQLVKGFAPVAAWYRRVETEKWNQWAPSWNILKLIFSPLKMGRAPEFHLPTIDFQWLLSAWSRWQGLKSEVAVFVAISYDAAKVFKNPWKSFWNQMPGNVCRRLVPNQIAVRFFGVESTLRSCPVPPQANHQQQICPEHVRVKLSKHPQSTPTPKMSNKNPAFAPWSEREQWMWWALQWAFRNHHEMCSRLFEPTTLQGVPEAVGSHPIKAENY